MAKENFEEKLYLENTLEYIKEEIKKEEQIIDGKIKCLIASRREMWEDTVHFSNDFDKIPEMVNYLSEVNNDTRSYDITKRK